MRTVGLPFGLMRDFLHIWNVFRTVCSVLMHPGRILYQNTLLTLLSRTQVKKHINNSKKTANPCLSQDSLAELHFVSLKRSSWMEYLQHVEAIPCILPRTEQNGRWNNRWREFDPQVTMHYAHANSLLLVTRERPPWIQSPVHLVAISACRAPSHPRWAVIGGEHVKKKKAC